MTKKSVWYGSVVPLQQIRYAGVLLLIIVVTGTLGYALTEEWPLLDSLYMTAITITTVGYGEVGQLSGTGKFFTICLIISSVGIAAYLVTRLEDRMSPSEANFLRLTQISPLTMPRHIL